MLSKIKNNFWPNCVNDHLLKAITVDIVTQKTWLLSYMLCGGPQIFLLMGARLRTTVLNINMATTLYWVYVMYISTR